MKTVLTVLFFAASLPASVAQSQTFNLDWFTIDGGGGISSCGGYSISGTIGQPDAGAPMTGGVFAVTGGFWALPAAAPFGDPPILTIVRSAPGQARISWTPNTTGYVLQESPGLSPANWGNSPSGAANPATVTTTSPAKFYRLRRP